MVSQLKNVLSSFKTQASAAQQGLTTFLNDPFRLTDKKINRAIFLLLLISAIFSVLNGCASRDQNPIKLEGREKILAAKEFLNLTEEGKATRAYIEGENRFKVRIPVEGMLNDELLKSKDSVSGTLVFNKSNGIPVIKVNIEATIETLASHIIRLVSYLKDELILQDYLKANPELQSSFVLISQKSVRKSEASVQSLAEVSDKTELVYFKARFCISLRAWTKLILFEKQSGLRGDFTELHEIGPIQMAQKDELLLTGVKLPHSLSETAETCLAQSKDNLVNHLFSLHQAK